MSKLLSWIKGVPYLGTAASFVFGNVRLVIEYALIGLVIASAATAIALWYRTNYLESRNDELRERVTHAEVVNEAQDKTIDQLNKLREMDAKVMEGLVSDYSKLAVTDSQARKNLSNLEKSNEDVRSYLDQSLPPDLVCLLNNTCPTGKDSGEGGKGKATGAAAGTVQKAGSAGDP